MAADLVHYIYNYNNSSWSMRSGLVLRQTGAPFHEISVLDEPEGLAGYKPRSPSGLFPLLKHGSDWFWDSLAIAEYLAELFPGAGLWPASSSARAQARCVVAEMHAGFSNLRSTLPMNIQAHHPGFLKLPPVHREIARVCAIWQTCLERYAVEGPFLFGPFTIADAFFAPVVMRFVTYDVELSPPLAAYADAVRATSAVKDWIARAQLDRHLDPAYEYTR